ncbi:MAG: peptidase T [Candidatus Dojkabacteria bacterium]|nr:peptidase T [Candidatus Dojkabacteria bacterium]MDQ7021077.1 peptidase T [Candidatus Dojkabacteria bacterium]
MDNKKYLDKIKTRFLKYVKYDTQSDPDSETYPSTEKELVLLNDLKNELNELGLDDTKIDEYGYVTAILKSNTEKNVPVLAFVSHVDTATEVTGKKVNPQLIENYDGSDIQLINDATQVIKVESNPYLKNLVGHDIVTTDGTTLLGADDKSGVAVVMSAIDYLINHPEIKHGDIKVLFNPDEEVGTGTKFFDVEKFGADYGYTLDGSVKGEIEFENFNAYGAKVKFFGKAIHPGYAKDKMINAIKALSYFVTLLPDEHSPEHTDGYKGFIHPITMNSGNEEASITFILRDFELEKINDYKEIINTLAKKAADQFGAKFEVEFNEQYKSMNEVIKNHIKVVDYAKEAMDRLGIEVITKPIRGGTDGATLTHKGLPCPKLFTGQQNYHGKQEYISLQDMFDSMRTVVEICKVWEEKS